MTRLFVLIIACALSGAFGCNSCNQKTIIEPCGPETELRLVCDVEATHDLFTQAWLFLQKNQPNEVVFLISSDKGELKVADLPLVFFFPSEPTRSYTDKEGVKIYVWHYDIPLPKGACAAANAFCGERVCPGNKVQFDFSVADHDLAWFIIMKPEVCRLQR